MVPVNQASMPAGSDSRGLRCRVEPLPAGPDAGDGDSLVALLDVEPQGVGVLRVECEDGLDGLALAEAEVQQDEAEGLGALVELQAGRRWDCVCEQRLLDVPEKALGHQRALDEQAPVLVRHVQSQCRDVHLAGAVV